MGKVTIGALAIIFLLYVCIVTPIQIIVRIGPTCKEMHKKYGKWWIFKLSAKEWLEAIIIAAAILIILYSVGRIVSVSIR